MFFVCLIVVCLKAQSLWRRYSICFKEGEAIQSRFYLRGVVAGRTPGAQCTKRAGGSAAQGVDVRVTSPLCTVGSGAVHVHVRPWWLCTVLSLLCAGSLGLPGKHRLPEDLFGM